MFLLTYKYLTKYLLTKYENSFVSRMSKANRPMYMKLDNIKQDYQLRFFTTLGANVSGSVDLPASLTSVSLTSLLPQLRIFSYIKLLKI